MMLIPNWVDDVEPKGKLPKSQLQRKSQNRVKTRSKVELLSCWRVSKRDKYMHKTDGQWGKGGCFSFPWKKKRLEASTQKTPKSLRRKADQNPVSLDNPRSWEANRMWYTSLLHKWSQSQNAELRQARCLLFRLCIKLPACKSWLFYFLAIWYKAIIFFILYSFNFHCYIIQKIIRIILRYKLIVECNTENMKVKTKIFGAVSFFIQMHIS